MTPQQFISLAARLFAIWLLVISLQIFAIATLINEQLGRGTFTAYIMPVFPLLLSVVLWLFPMSIAHKLLPKTDDTNFIHMPAREFTAAASAIIGIWVLISSIPSLAGSVALLMTGHTNGGVLFAHDQMLQSMTVLIQCIIGLFLVMKPWFVAHKIFPTKTKDDNTNKS